MSCFLALIINTVVYPESCISTHRRYKMPGDRGGIGEFWRPAAILEGHCMQDAASELRRIPLLGTWVNKDETKGRSLLL